MSKKMIMGSMIFLMICFLLLSGICFLAAKNHEGTTVHSGYMKGDTFVKINSGSIGRNSVKMEQFETWGAGCLIIAGLFGTTCLLVKIFQKE